MPTWPAKTNYATGDVLTAAQMQDIGNALNSLESAQYAAGKNKIINGDMRIAQRGTSFSNPNGIYTLDRYRVSVATAVPTWTVSQETFTPGTAPVAGYEASNFLRMAVSSQGSSTGQTIATRLEDVRLLAGQSATFSFWAKAGSTITISDIKIGQNFGSGGSGAVETTVTLNSTSITTSWARYTGTITVPSVSGKTIGTGSYLYPSISVASSQGNYTLDLWGWQLEAGNTATAFQTATGTLAGELAACQRYFQRFTCGGANGRLAIGMNDATTSSALMMNLPVSMRSTPPILDFGNLQIAEPGNSNFAFTGLTVSSLSTNTQMHLAASGLTGLTVYRPCYLTGTGNTSYISFSSEL